MISMLGLVPSVTALKLRGGGQRLTAPSELQQQTAFPSGNPLTCFTLTYFFAFPEDQEYETMIFV